MPIEIKELQITASVNTQSKGKMDTVDLLKMKKQILAECAELINRLHKEKTYER